MKLILLLLISSIASLAQPSATTSAPCSPIAPNNTGSITISCPGISQDQGQKLIAILNKILAKQIDPETVLTKLDEIQSDVRKLRQGIYSGYDFNGARRETRPGYTGAVAGNEFTVFQAMIKLQANKNWPELLTAAEGQIKKTPDWLTPYLFSGIANANLGNKSAAIERLTFVRDQAAGDPNYADADRILTLLQK